jgi:hypothetical protein
MKSSAVVKSILVVIALGSALPASAGLVYTCNSNIGSSTCNYLNTTVAGIYDGTFTNVSADIYIQMGSTGLGASNQWLNGLTYTQYLNALNSNPNKDAVDLSALTALNTFDTGIYGAGNVVITAALGSALGFSSLTGTTSSDGSCALGTSGCYDGVITISNTAPLYYRTGTETSSQYDFYSVAQHETDEVLGTISCITTGGSSLADFCGAGVPAPIDLFRYSSAGHLVSNFAPSTTPGAYFSYNGGQTNGADGATFNTYSNGEDYADFATNCQFVQDAVGCPGSGGLNVNNDGPGGTPGPEVSMLDAVGYNVAATPEPGTVGMLALGFAVLGMAARRRRSRA